MEICKTSTLRLKVLNKHIITHIMCIKMENVISKKKRKKKGKLKYWQGFKRNYAKYARMHHTRTHTRTHTIQTDRGEGQCCLTEIFWEEKCLEFAVEGRESAWRLGGDCSRCGSQSVRKCKSHGFCGWIFYMFGSCSTIGLNLRIPIWPKLGVCRVVKCWFLYPWLYFCTPCA